MASKKPQSGLSDRERLILQTLADLQSTGRVLLLREPSWSAGGLASADTPPSAPHRFLPVPQSLLLAELTLSAPDATSYLAEAVTTLQQRGLLQVVPTPSDGHVDFAYHRRTGEVLLSRTSPEDGLTTVTICRDWPPKPTDKPLSIYEYPLQDDGPYLGVGYQINDAALGLLNQPQPTQVRQEPSQDANLTPREVAALYKVDIDQVYGWINSGLLRAKDVSRQGSRKRRYVIDRKALADFETQRTLNPKPETRRKLPGADIIEFYH